jgi:hypothetical protein
MGSTRSARPGPTTIFAGFGSGETAGPRTMFSQISGVTLITRGAELRRTGKSLHPVLPKAA